MSYAEFPSTIMHLEDGDHHELIEFYIEVRDKYTATLAEITRVDNEVKQYRADMQNEISSSVELAVTKQLATSLNEINDEIKSLWADVHLNKSEIEKLQESNASLLAKMLKLEKDIVATDTKIFVLKSEFDDKLSVLSRKIDSTKEDIEEELSAQITAGDTSTLSKAQGYAYRLNTKTKNEIQNQIESLETTASAEAITWLWQYGCCHGGFTAEEWYHLTKICNKVWEDVSPSAWEWYTMGKDMFRKYTRNNKMYSPVSGRFVDTRVALMELAYKLDVGNLSTEDYDALGFTAEEYDNYKLTAEEYDWNGKEKLDVQ